ncbi:FAD-dependent monooxygenase [Holospora curviuscula]|uniref:2-octaprenylphenol hydroxylase n=1 Tax=Holospora curviuscula TaxID=1082868 RepID=A0A2S5R9U9_9PROT|nr:NAD(P)/FAD-dependent oxidoreductase [Holospora curviuscula]PPE03972.1 2-octaprenylphenol hydroxylase [Holospora curviuscula]
MNYREVLVVGGGIIGFVSALRLALEGVSCVVLERKSLGYWNEGLRYFAVAQDVIQWLSHWKIVDLNGFWPIHNAALRMDTMSNEIQFSCKQSEEPRLGVMIQEKVLMEMLVTRLQKFSHVSLFFSKNLQRIWSDSEYVYVLDKENSLYRGRCCIAADGNKSWVRSQLENKPYYYDFGQIASTGVVQFQGDAHTVWDFFSKDQCVGILPFSYQQAAFILMGSSRKTIPSQENAFQKNGFFSLLNRGLRDKIKILGLDRWDGQYPLTAGRCKYETHGLVLFLGDALEWMHPLMGQGMNLALRYASKWLDALPEALISGVCLQKWLRGHRQKNWQGGLGVNVGAIALQGTVRSCVWKAITWGTLCPGVSKWCLKRGRIPFRTL